MGLCGCEISFLADKINIFLYLISKNICHDQYVRFYYL